MAKVSILDKSIEDLMAASKTKDERKIMLDYFRGLQQQENKAIEMAALNQIQVKGKGKKDYPSAASIVAFLTQPATSNDAPTERPSAVPDVVFVPSVPLTELQPFKALSKLTVTDWLLVLIAVLLFVNIIRK